MVTKIDDMRVGKEADGRRHLDDADRAKIKQLHKEGIGIREIARRYEHICSRRTIQFVIFPERLSTVNYPGHYKKYYNKDKHTIAMRKHRAKKALILKQNKG
jgi:IS30 family transposase